MYKTLLALLAFTGVQAARGATYTTTVVSTNVSNHNYINVWGDYSTDGNMTELAQSPAEGIRYFKADGKKFTDAQLARESSAANIETTLSGVEAWALLSGSYIWKSQNFSLWVKVNGADKSLYFDTEVSPGVFKTENITSTGSDQLWGYKDAAQTSNYGWVGDVSKAPWPGVPTSMAGLLGSYVDRTVNVDAGLVYHYELNVPEQTIEVVIDSEVEWFYKTGDGERVPIGKDQDSYTFTLEDVAVDATIIFYRHNTEMGAKDSGSNKWDVGGSVDSVNLGACNKFFKIIKGGDYTFTITGAQSDTPTLRIEYSEPAARKWYYWIEGGEKTLMAGSDGIWEHSVELAEGDKIGFYKNDNEYASCYESNGDYALTGAVESGELINNKYWFRIRSAGKYTFTITGSDMKIDYKAPLSTDPLYLSYSTGKDKWQAAVEMTANDTGVYSRSVSLPEGSYFGLCKTTNMVWNDAANAYGAPSTDCPIADGETKDLTAGQGYVFNIAASGRYTIFVNADRTQVWIKRTGDYTGGGNWEGAEDLNAYVDNENNTDIINYITPSEGSAAEEYSIRFAYTKGDGGKLSQKLTATHRTTAGEGTLVWMKYETLGWNGENTEGIDRADALYLSDTHLYENGKRGALVATSKFMDELKCNSLAELIESRTHCVHHSGTGCAAPKKANEHTPRNFREAYYRVYGMHEASPVAETSARVLSANDRRIKAVVTPSHPSRYEARVAYTAAVEDNTSGVTGVEMDKDVIGCEDVAPVYYNLQGVRVSRPSAGQVYIVKRGDKVTKEIIK